MPMRCKKSTSILGSRPSKATTDVHRINAHTDTYTENTSITIIMRITKIIIKMNRIK